jgi:hypothetical protein
MPERQFIYLVTSGDYSDYAVIAAFSSEAKAKEYREKSLAVNADLPINRDIERFEVDSMEPVSHRDLYDVMLDYDSGDLKRVSVDEGFDGFMCNSDFKEVGKLIRTNDGTFRIFCFAKDQGHALKIASERLAVAKANPWMVVDDRY